jgi:chaperone BCS1
VDNANNIYGKYTGGGIKIYTNNGDGWMSSKSVPNERSLNTVILRGDLQQQIIRDVRFFIDNEKWFAERGIPHKLGLLFYGVPGTGKTSMINAIASLTARNIYYLIVDNISSDSKYLYLMSCVGKTDILVIEDVDRTTFSSSGRDQDDGSKSSKETAVSFSTILNSLDGLLSEDGRITIFTANHPDMLDRALLRPGRVDHMYHLEKCDQRQIAQLYKMVFDKECSENLLARIPNDKYTPAEIITHLTRHMLSPDDVFGDDLMTNEEEMQKFKKNA